MAGMLLAPLARTAAASGWTPGLGPYAVGSSCMLAEPATAAPSEHYLIGRWQPNGSLYLDQLISDRSATLVIDVKVPEDWPGAARLAGQSLPVVLSVLYPTSATNTRPDYTFPKGLRPSIWTDQIFHIMGICAQIFTISSVNPIFGVRNNLRTCVRSSLV
jgi:hypothetical protein